MFVDTGHGTGVDSLTLVGVIHDDEAFEAWRRSGSDGYAAVIGPLFRGDPAAAQAAMDVLAASGDRSSLRFQAFQADICRDLGDDAGAVAIYEKLLTEYVGSRQEAVLLQHLGKVHFLAGRLDEARKCFIDAGRLRAADPDTPDDQLRSTAIALARVEQLLADGSGSTTT